MLRKRAVRRAPVSSQKSARMLRSCATPQSSRRTTDGWCARFRARSGRRLHRRRALRLGRGASPTPSRSNARPLLLRPVCMPLLLALTQRVLAARRPGVPAACIADALRRARRRCVPLRAAVRRAPGVCPRATGYARRHAFCRAATLAALGAAPPTSDAPSRRASVG